MITHTIKLTGKCNQKCGFCSDLHPNETKLEDIKKHILDLDYSERINIDFSGGEPTTVQFLPEIIKFTKKNKNCRVSLQSNGVRFSDKEYAKQIKEAGLDFVRVSLHSPSQEVSDSLTSIPGSFEKTVDGIRNLISLDLVPGISFVINSQNYEKLPEFCKWVLEEFPEINRFAFAGVAESKNYNTENKLIIKFSEYADQLNKAITILKDNNKTVTLCGIPYCFTKGHEDSFFIGQNCRDFVKDKKCSNCMLGQECKGVMKEYADFFGTSEVEPYTSTQNPLKEKPSRDPSEYSSFNRCSESNITQEEKEQTIFEKKKHLIVTSKCNNNCMFCLMGDNRHDQKPLSDIKKEMENGTKEGDSKIILSGGDPTIHPDIIEIVKLAKDIGYKKVQTITNGRMYSYPGFINSMVSAGLDEITFSVHGHTGELHDVLTGTKGSFEQTVTGIKNAVHLQNQGKLIVNADIVINKMNYSSLLGIVKFLHGLGVMEIDLLQITPFGYAWDNKQEIMYDSKELNKYLSEAISFGKSKGIVIWTNRIQPACLEGNEEYIQDPHKLNDEVRGRKKHFEACLSNDQKPFCMGERCSYCCLEQFCTKLFNLNDLLKEHKITKAEVSLTSDDLKEELSVAKKLGAKDITLSSAESLPADKIINAVNLATQVGLKSISILFSIDFNPAKEKFFKEKIEGLKELKVDYKLAGEVNITKKNNTYLSEIASFLNESGFDELILKPADPPQKISEYKHTVIQIKEILKNIYPLIDLFGNKVLVKDIPSCFFGEKYKNYLSKGNTLKLEYLTKDHKQIDLTNFLEGFLKSIKTKSFRCAECTDFSDCEGIFTKYACVFGFKELIPFQIYNETNK